MNANFQETADKFNDIVNQMAVLVTTVNGKVCYATISMNWMQL